jgi:hypothetical protein
MLTPTLVSIVMVSSLTTLFVLPYGMALAAGVFRNGSAQARFGATSARSTVRMGGHVHDRRRDHTDRPAASVRRAARPGSRATRLRGASERISRSHLERKNQDQMCSTNLS